MAAGLNAQERPNIVLIFPDNLGWGEVGVYGSVRGAPTPRLDQLAAEGIRLTNFNVEYSCTVSRAALLTGRYAVRTGTAHRSGMTPWEVTIAEALKSVGYATALFDKWHVGGNEPMGRREPTHQGFDALVQAAKKAKVPVTSEVFDMEQIHGTNMFGKVEGVEQKIADFLKKHVPTPVDKKEKKKGPGSR